MGEIIRQEVALVRFAERCLVTPEQVAKLRRGKVAGGAEHEVFILENQTRVWKMTKKDRWGFKKDSPMDYVLRMYALALHTEPLDIQIEGIAIQNGLPSIVTSMAYIHGPHPTPKQLAAKMKRDGCILVPDATGLLAYHDPVTGFTFRDAHPGNFIIAAPGIFVPIDVAIESP